MFINHTEISPNITPKKLFNAKVILHGKNLEVITKKVSTTKTTQTSLTWMDRPRSLAIGAGRGQGGHKGSAHLARLLDVQQEIGSLNVGVDVLVVMNIFQHVQLQGRQGQREGRVGGWRAIRRGQG